MNANDIGLSILVLVVMYGLLRVAYHAGEKDAWRWINAEAKRWNRWWLA